MPIHLLTSNSLNADLILLSTHNYLITFMTTKLDWSSVGFHMTSFEVCATIVAHIPVSDHRAFVNVC